MKILANQLTEASFARNNWVVSGDFSRADLMRPETWAHVAFKLKPGDHIEILSEDASWWAELVVRSVDGVEIVLGEIASVTFDAAERVPDDYKIVWAGPIAKHRVIRVSDNIVVREGFSSKAAAAAFIAEPVIDRAA